MEGMYHSQLLIVLLEYRSAIAKFLILATQKSLSCGRKL